METRLPGMTIARDEAGKDPDAERTKRIFLSYRMKVGALQNKLGLVRAFRAIAEKSVRVSARHFPQVSRLVDLFRAGNAGLEKALRGEMTRIRNSMERAAESKAILKDEVRRRFDAQMDLMLMGIACLNLVIACLRAVEAAVADKLPPKAVAALSYRRGRMFMGVEACLAQSRKDPVDAGLVVRMRDAIRAKIAGLREMRPVTVDLSEVVGRLVQAAEVAGFSKTRLPGPREALGF